MGDEGIWTLKYQEVLIELDSWQTNIECSKFLSTTSKSIFGANVLFEINIYNICYTKIAFYHQVKVLIDFLCK